MQIINNHVAQTELIKGLAVIIDVREPIEYNAQHIPGALNIASTKYNKDAFLPFKDLKICLVCESGARAREIHNRLKLDGFHHLEILEHQMEDVQEMVKKYGWSVDRQFRMTLGLALLIFLILHFIGLRFGILIPIILSTGLIITSIIDRCYMRIGIAKLPWNKGKAVPQ